MRKFFSSESNLRYFFFKLLIKGAYKSNVLASGLVYSWRIVDLIQPNLIFFTHKTDCLGYRLELKGNKYVLGEFLEFKGKKEDVEALRHIRRSKVGRMLIQKTSMFGLGNLALYSYYI
jgi:hypothetical protein